MEIGTKHQNRLRRTSPNFRRKLLTWGCRFLRSMDVPVNRVEVAGFEDEFSGSGGGWPSKTRQQRKRPEWWWKASNQQHRLLMTESIKEVLPLLLNLCHCQNYDQSMSQPKTSPPSKGERLVYQFANTTNSTPKGNFRSFRSESMCLFNSRNTWLESQSLTFTRFESEQMMRNAHCFSFTLDLRPWLLEVLHWKMAPIKKLGDCHNSIKNTPFQCGFLNSISKWP